jgi:hypothetical protein
MTKATHHSQVIHVAGSGEFPLDMLRYDSCVPRAQADVARLDYHGRDVSLFRIVELYMFSTSSDALPTRTRWQSYGWHVLSRHDRDVFAMRGLDGLRRHLKELGDRKLCLRRDGSSGGECILDAAHLDADAPDGVRSAQHSDGRRTWRDRKAT